MAELRIDTASGKYIDILNLKPEDIDFEAIAHSLSNQCRFAGHTSRFYSVAEHSYITSMIPGMTGVSDTTTALTMLLHDAAEAFISDIPSPIRRLTPLIVKLEDEILVRVFERVHLDYKALRPTIERYDKIALNCEAIALMRSMGRTWGVKASDGIAVVIRAIEYPGERTPADAKSLWLSEFYAITADLGIKL